MDVELREARDVPTRAPNPDWFTGSVLMTPIVDAPEPARVTAVSVSFSPGARTAWHTHPYGQTLHVLSGVGRVQAEGQPVRELTPGATVWIPPDIRHWHGAAPDHAMTHIAIQEKRDGSQTSWAEKVSDDDYLTPVER